MAHYYFVGTLLPTLSFEAKPEMTFSELDQLLRDNLTPKDYQKTRIIRGFFDVLNLRALWLGESFDLRGEMTEAEVEEALAARLGLPDYVYLYVDTYHSIEERIAHFPLLFARFFQKAIETKDTFLREYFTFERELRLVVTALRARELGRDLSKEFLYEDPEDELIQDLLAQKEGLSLELPEKLQELNAIFEQNKNDPLALQGAIDLYRVEMVERQVSMSDLFSIKRILAYLIEFILIENWFTIDKAKGISIIDSIKEK